MSDGLLALDQGTTSSKALLLDPTTLTVIASASRPVGITGPRPGWVEQDAAEIWESVRAAAAQVLADRPDVRPIAIAIANQRESVVAWEPGTGAPLGPLLSWQDQRAAQGCADLATAENLELVEARTGLQLNSMYSATKLRWLIDHTSRRDARLGTVDTWLLDRLTGGTTYAIEAGNASRTLLFDIARLAWDADLCDLFGVPLGALPEVRPSNGPWGTTRGVPGIPDGIPILAVLGDSHAALYGHWALAPEHAGTGKATYGTGSSVMLPAPAASNRIEGISTTLAWQLDDPCWAFEANILYSGAGLDWLGTTLGVPGGRGLSELAAATEDSGGVVFVPALNGLGAPWWEPAAIGGLTGLTARTTRHHIARAGLEAVAHQICDVVEAMDADAPSPLLHVGGGATASDLLMQIQANLLNRELLVAPVADISPLGAGALAARGLGIDAAPGGPEGRRFTPSSDFPVERRTRERAQWRDALARAGVHQATTNPQRTDEGARK